MTQPVTLALRRAEAGSGHRFDAIVVGDTPSDIKAARAISARAVGVTTGHYTRAQLEEAGADVVVDSLADVLPD